MSKSYFLLRNGRAFGPYAQNQLIDAAKSGKLLPSDSLSVDEKGPGQPVNTIPALASLMKSGQGNLPWSNFESTAVDANSSPAPISNPYWKNMSHSSSFGPGTQSSRRSHRVEKDGNAQESRRSKSGIRYIVMSFLLLLVTVGLGAIALSIIPDLKIVLERVREGQRSPYQELWDEFASLYKEGEYRTALDVVRRIKDQDSQAKGPEGKTAAQWEDICFIKNAERFNRNVDGWLKSGGSLDDLDRRLKKK